MSSVTELGSILGIGAHVPKLRLSHSVISAAIEWTSAPGRKEGRGARAICNWDEDSLTMAVEAARSCAGGADIAQAVSFCSTTAPFADRDAAVLLAEVLGCPQTIETFNLAGSLRCGTRGLAQALQRSAASSTLVVASDARLTRPGSPQEMAYGDAAAAALVGAASPDALATVIACRSLGSDFVDHYRMSHSKFDYALEERWVRDESLLELVPRIVSELLGDAGVPTAAVRHFALPVGGATAQKLAKACDLKDALRDPRVLAECGDAGSALPLLMLAGSLEAAAPGDFIVLVGIGQGVDAMLLRVGGGVRHAQKPLTQTLELRREESSYVRYLSSRGLIDMDFGMRAERDQRTAHTVAFRKRAALNAFEGGKCGRCGTVQFPKSRVCVNPGCRATDAQTAHRLADSRGRVKTFTEDWQAYAARPPYIYGNVEFAEGGNLFMEFTDIGAGELRVDDPVRFVYRIKDEDRARGFRRYFWKATT